MSTYALGKARSSSAGNPITTAYTVNAGDSVIVILIKTVGATNRAGAAPTLSGGDQNLNTATFTQANSTQKAAAGPEASAEIWYFENPIPGSYTLTIPNTSAFTIFYTVVIGKAAAGGRMKFVSATGNNSTGTNPTPGTFTVGETNCIIFAITAGGWTTWNPSAQPGTVIANTDDGADGGGEQYILNPSIGTQAAGWTFGTSDDWGAVAVMFRETPPIKYNNLLGVKADSGISVTERRR